MASLHISSLIRPNVLIFLDIRGSNWETWLAQIRSDAIICDVWEYIDPAIPIDQIPALNPPARIPPQGFFFTREDVEEVEEEVNQNNGNNNNFRVVSDWTVSRILVYDRVREWRLYDEAMYSLRVIRAFILATVPVGWVTYLGVFGGGPLGDVRRLLGSLSERVAVIRVNLRNWVMQGAQRRAGYGGGGGGGGGSAGSAGVGAGIGTVGAPAGGFGGAGTGTGAGVRAGTGTGSVGAPSATEMMDFTMNFPWQGIGIE